MKMEDDNQGHEKLFSVEIAKQGRAVCKKCKQKCVQGDLRVAKLIPNPVGSGKMKTWHHVNCIFEAFLKQRQTTKRIEGPHDVEGWELLHHDDKVDILKKIRECNKAFEVKFHKSSKGKKNANKGKHHTLLNEDCLSVSSDSPIKEDVHKDNCFREFRTIVANVSNESSSNEKIRIFREIFAKGSDGTGFKGDIFLWCKLLLPSIIKRVFHLQTKQLVKTFSRVFHVKDEIIMSHLDQGDVGQTIQYFFEQSKEYKPAKKSALTIFEVDEFLETLTTLSKEDDQYNHFKTFIKKCTANDLKVVIRLIKHDLRMNAGAKHVFEGLHSDAYLIFQSCRDIRTVIKTCWVGPLKIDKPPIENLPSPRASKRSTKRKVSNSEPKNKKLKLLDVKDAAKNKSKLEKLEAKIENSLEIEIPEAKSKKVKLLEVKDAVKSYAKLEKPEPEVAVSCEVEIAEARTCIPNYFENVKLYLEDGVTERHAEWVRYFIAYGGAVLKSDEHQQATHVLHLKDTIAEPTIPCAASARHVIVEWIKHTVEGESLQDYRPYTVRWKPDHKD